MEAFRPFWQAGMSEYLELIQSRCDIVSRLQRVGNECAYDHHVEHALIKFHQHAIASKSITPELASQAISIVNRSFGEAAATTFTQALKPLVNMGPTIEPHVQVNTIHMQICCFDWHCYLTEKLWRLYISSCHIDDKIWSTAVHMAKLGLKHPTEATTVYAAGLIHYMADGILAEQKAALLTSRKLKWYLKLIWGRVGVPRPELLGPTIYPTSREMFKVGYPHLYEAALGGDLAADCPIGEFNLFGIIVSRMLYESDPRHRIDPSNGDKGKRKGQLKWYFDKSKRKYVPKSTAKHEAKKSPPLPQWPIEHVIPWKYCYLHEYRGASGAKPHRKDQ